jgi:hypothetical protein
MNALSTLTFVCMCVRVFIYVYNYLSIIIQPCPANYYSTQTGATTKDACIRCDSTKSQTSASGSSVCDIPRNTGTKAVSHATTIP